MCCHIPAAPRLACVRPVASVHPEPGSNSSLLFYIVLVFSVSSHGAPAMPAAPRGAQYRPVRSIPAGCCVFILFSTCFGNLTREHIILLSCTVSSLLFLYCNRFNVLSLSVNRGSFQNSLAKLRQVFITTKLFNNIFCYRFLAAPLNVRSRKASAKLQPHSGFSKCRGEEISFTKTRYRPKNMFYNILFHSAK